MTALPEAAVADQVAEWVITEVRLCQAEEGTTYWALDLLRPDGVKILQVMPTELLESLSAEYDIPPDDVDQLLDIALHQPFLPVPRRDRQLAVSSALGVASPTAVAAAEQAESEPVTLWNAPTIDDARRSLLARIEELKQKVRVLPFGQSSAAAKTRALNRAGLAGAEAAAIVEAPTDPLDLIRSTAVFDKHALARKRAEVAAARREYATATGAS
ncbi:hypothetical protein [Nonomuraea sp. B19D2]|uniref:hypothetical protein n=1 Tax=Nonomuraea sp. B19D2 TaxID=3159561 RepID=UPI0032DAB857